MRYLARPRSLFTFHFEVFAGDRPVGSLRHRAFRPGGQLWVDGTGYRVLHDGFGAWSVEQEGVPGEVARIERTGPLRRTYRLTWDGSGLEMARAFLGYRTDLIAGGAVVGEIHQRSLMERSLVAEFPDDVPPVAVLACLWLVVRLRRRAAGARAGGGA